MQEHIVIKDFTQIIHSWAGLLKPYDFKQLCTKPSKSDWSLGQVYMHVISETNFYLEQAEICFSNKDNLHAEMSTAAKTMFLNNQLPDEKIEGPVTNAETAQPINKEELVAGLNNLLGKLGEIVLFLNEDFNKGKTQHSGLGFFTAKEWIQFAAMHFKHHERQKKRIDHFLHSNTTSQH